MNEMPLAEQLRAIGGAVLLIAAMFAALNAVRLIVQAIRNSRRR